MHQEPGKPSGVYRTSFGELHVRIGARLQLVSSTFGRKSPLASTLLGYAEREYLIVRTPAEGGLALRLPNGEFFDVRLFTGTHFVEFSTSLLRQFGAPISYWHLSYPDDVRATALRAAPRTRVDLGAQATRSGASPVSVRLIDLSASGAKVLAPEPLGERGQKLDLAFDIPCGSQGTAVNIAVPATIRSVKPPATEDDAPLPYAHGLQFESISETNRLLLQCFVLQKLNEAPATVV